MGDHAHIAITETHEFEAGQLQDLFLSAPSLAFFAGDIVAAIVLGLHDAVEVEEENVRVPALVCIFCAHTVSFSHAAGGLWASYSHSKD